MGLLFLDSFDDRYFANGASYEQYHKTKWEIVSEDSTNTYANSISQVTGRTGKACKIGGNSYLQKTGYNIQDYIIWGLGFKVESAPASDTTIIEIEISYNEGSSTGYIYYKLTPTLYFKVFQDTTEFVISTSALSLNTFYYIESAISLVATTLKLHKDGSSWLSFDASVPIAFSQPVFKKIKFMGNIIIDDLYIANNNTGTLYGQVKIEAIVPNADTSLSRSNPWSASYLDVDECYQTNYDGTTSYDVSNTASPSSVSYNFTDKNYTSIKGIQSNSWVAAFLSSGSPTNITFSSLANVSGTDYEYGTTLSLAPTTPAAFKYLFGIWENNPANSQAWTSSTYNSAEFGVKASGHISGLSIGYLTAITLEIAYIGEEVPPTPTRSRVFLIT